MPQNFLNIASLVSKINLLPGFVYFLLGGHFKNWGGLNNSLPCKDTFDSCWGIYEIECLQWESCISASEIPTLLQFDLIFKEIAIALDIMRDVGEIIRTKCTELEQRVTRINLLFVLYLKLLGSLRDTLNTWNRNEGVILIQNVPDSLRIVPEIQWTSRGFGQLHQTLLIILLLYYCYIICNCSQSPINLLEY